MQKLNVFECVIVLHCVISPASVPITGSMFLGFVCYGYKCFCWGFASGKTRHTAASSAQTNIAEHDKASLYVCHVTGYDTMYVSM